MKSMNESFKVFSNTIKEVSTLQQRLESSYDEIGEVLGKYYEIKEGNEFGAERAKAIAAGKDSFEVDGKSFKVTGVDAEDKKNAEEFANESMKLTSLLKREELKGDQHKIDVDGDGEIEASDLAALRAGKKKDESVNEGIGTIALGVAGGLLLLKVLKFVLKKVVGAIGMNAPLPKEKLLQVVQTMVKTVIAQSSGKQIDMLQLVALQSFLKDEINAGKITTVKQIMQVIDKASKIQPKEESVNEAKFKVLASFGGYDLIEAPTEKDMIISKNGKKVGKLTKTSKYLKDDIKSFINMVKSDKLGESVNEEEIKWNAVENAIINFLKMNTKILDKRVQAKDTEGVKGGLKSIISGLTNAQRNLKLESINEAFSDNKNLNALMKGRKITNVAYDSNLGFAVILDNGKYIQFDAHSARPGQSKDMKFESVNEITFAQGLKALLKGNTSSVEGIKVSPELANAIASWSTNSIWGQRYGSQLMKAPFANAWKMIFSSAYGVESHLKRFDKATLAKVKPELAKIQAKLGM
jgi:hypothetical protein